MELAVGLIETKGLVGAIEAADAMAKAADVKIVNKEKSTAALVTIKIVGEVAAVKSAVDAGAAAAQRVGQLISAHIIPRPHKDIDSIINETEKIVVPDSDQRARRSTRTEKAPSEERNKEPRKEPSKPVREKKAEAKKEDVKPAPPVPEPEKIEKAKPKEVKDDVKSELPVPAHEAKKEKKKALKEAPKKDEDSAEKEDETKLLTSAEKDEDLEFNGLDHLKQLREEAKSELKITDIPEREPAQAKAAVNIPPVEELETMNVHQLRKVARSIPDFPIKGREISMANRGVLLDYLKKL